MNNQIQQKNLVYICSPYAGDVEENLRRARQYSRYAVFQGAIPVTPHLLYPQFLQDAEPAEREIGTECAMALLALCDELWAFGDRISKGMAAEIEYAKKAYIPVRYFVLVPREVHPE